jgi:hypothetical protein
MKGKKTLLLIAEILLLSFVSNVYALDSSQWFDVDPGMSTIIQITCDDGDYVNGTYNVDNNLLIFSIIDPQGKMILEQNGTTYTIEDLNTTTRFETFTFNFTAKGSGIYNLTFSNPFYGYFNRINDFAGVTLQVHTPRPAPYEFLFFSILFTITILAAAIFLGFSIFFIIRKRKNSLKAPLMPKSHIDATKK